MTQEILIFWLIHLFIGVGIPALVYWGCSQKPVHHHHHSRK